MSDGSVLIYWSNPHSDKAERWQHLSAQGERAQSHHHHTTVQTEYSLYCPLTPGVVSTEIHQNKSVSEQHRRCPVRFVSPCGCDICTGGPKPAIHLSTCFSTIMNIRSINSTRKVNMSGWRSLHEDRRSSSLTSVQIFLRRSTFVLSSWASPVQALASRKSPLRMAILFPNCMSFSGPSESVNSFRLTIPRCTRNAVWINSVISAKFLWLWHKRK